MKTLLAILLLIPSVGFCQWRPVAVSTPTDTRSIEENFRRASIYSNRKLDKYTPDTMYKKLTLKDDLILEDGGVLTSTAPFAHLAATQTFTGANTFTSSITSSGNNNWTGTNSFSGDTTISNLYGVSRSSTTGVIPQTTGTNTTFSSCVNGSTLTITTGNNPAMVVFSGLGMTNVANNGILLTLLIDGEFPTGSTYSSTNGIAYAANATASSANNMSFTFVTPTLTAGQHTFCLAAKAQVAGTWYILNDGYNGVPRMTVMNLPQ